MILSHLDRVDDPAIFISDIRPDLAPNAFRAAQLWAYHGAADCAYLTPDDAERAEADILWDVLRHRRAE